MPFLDFLKELDSDTRIEIIAAIDELIEWQNNKLQIPSSKAKYLRNKIFEMRVRHKNIISRSLYFLYEGKKIVFTNGFIKKTNRVPDIEIRKAEKLRNYYISIKEGKND
ncbi:MAG TPA: type II toxin-antitoxin system RelE/ParE family toxin [Bacteroidota bacterium]|nr:type II toxin-antitoxin system RelE/ParE family toxin [Candidatus Kapabacteria bacterium]HRS02313.1 type II toxin-antitoxin system RelE/ParE family toxin [Bacteroidota bacterium]